MRRAGELAEAIETRGFAVLEGVLDLLEVNRTLRDLAEGTQPAAVCDRLNGLKEDRL